MDRDTFYKSCGRFFTYWLALTVASAIALALVFLFKGHHGIGLLVQKGYASRLAVTFWNVGAAWMTLGLFSGLVRLGRINDKNLYPALLAVGAVIMYCGLLRERLDFGDFSIYFDAASNLAADQGLPYGYLYPPLWAAMLAPLTHGGELFTLGVCWFLQLAALAAFAWLLWELLRQYGVSPEKALIAVALFLVINTPLIRNLFYSQINLLVLALTFAAVFLFTSRPLFSALLMALAVDLKLAPAVLALGFLLERKIKWTVAFLFFTMIIALLPALFFGGGPYADFWINLQNARHSNGLCFRETSFDSFFAALCRFTQIPPVAGSCAALASKAGVLVWVIFLYRSSGIPASPGNPSPRLYAAMPLLLILMTLLSPLVWEHYAVFLALPFLITAFRLTSPASFALFAIAFALEFWLPIFDFFPFSYGRLVAPIILLRLIQKHGKQTTVPGFGR